MKFFRTHHLERAKHILVVDIGTATVNAFLVRQNPHRPPEVLSTKRFNLGLAENPDFLRMWRQVKGALRELASFLKSTSEGAHVDMVFTVLSSPWYASQTRLVHMEPKKEFFTTEEILRKLVREEQDLFEKKMQARFALPQGSLAPLEGDIMKSALNGYHVRSPLKKKARFLDLAVYVSFVRKEVLEDIFEIFRQAWRQADMRVCSGPLMLFRALQGALNFEEGFILLDVGGEITEIFLIRKFMIESMATFLRGGNSLIRRLAARLNMPFAEAAGLLKLQGRQDGKESLKKTLSQALEEGTKEWAEFFSEALGELSPNGYLPATLVFLGGGAGIDALKTATESERFSRFNALGKPFRTVTILPENLRQNLEGSAIDRKDPQMTLPLLFVLSASENYGI